MPSRCPGPRIGTAELVSIEDGTLVRIQRMPKSWLRSKTTKRHGTQCLLRRFDVVFLGPDGQAAHRGTGYATADAAQAEATKDVASKRVPFHAIVTHKGLREVHIVRLLLEDEAKAMIRTARQRREDAEWDAAAPRTAIRNEKQDLSR